MKFKFYIERKDSEDEWEELELEVDASYYAGCPARLGSYEHSSPSEPEEIETTLTLNGKPFNEDDLDEEEKERLLDKVREEAHNEYESAMEARAEERCEDYYDYDF